MKMSKAVIITDLRLFTVVTALQIFDRTKSDYLLISEEAIHSQEFGSKSSEGYKRLKVGIVRRFYPLEVIATKDVQKVRHPKGINSSLISETTDALATPEKYPDLYRNFSRQAAGAESVSQELAARSVKEIYVFNGRLASSYGICKSAAEQGIKTWFYEWGELPFCFTIQGYPIHKLDEKAFQAIAIYENPNLLPSYFYWEPPPSVTIEQKLNNYYARGYGKGAGEESRYDIVIFLGSPHELYTIDGLDFKTDIDFCNMVRERYGEGKKYAIRAHPNQTKDPSWRTFSQGMQEYAASVGADYYGPNSKINSHDLIRRAEKVVTAFSSISIDAYFLGADVDVLGKTYFKYLIEYCDRLNAPKRQKQEVLARLLNICQHLNQEHLHPKWTLMLKLLNRLDRLFIHNVHFNN